MKIVVKRYTDTCLSGCTAQNDLVLCLFQSEFGYMQSIVPAESK